MSIDRSLQLRLDVGLPADEPGEPAAPAGPTAEPVGAAMSVSCPAAMSGQPRS